MDSKALVQISLLRVRRASRNLFRIVSFGAQFLCTGLHALHRSLSRPLLRFRYSGFAGASVVANWLVNCHAYLLCRFS